VCKRLSAIQQVLQVSFFSLEPSCVTTSLGYASQVFTLSRSRARCAVVNNPNRMSADDVSKLAAFGYHSHPDIFHDVVAQQPAIVKFLSNPLIGAALGAVAAKWLGNRK
jgi:hypothetical protein